MAIIRWEPAREIGALQSEVNRLFGTFFDTQAGGGGAVAARRWVPAMDLVEDGDHYVLRADLPGVREDDVEIELDDNVLTVSGERRSQHDEQRDGYRRIERSYGSFSRSLTVPDGIDPERIEASFDGGVLEVRVPKPEQAKPRRVAISVGAKSGAEAGEKPEEGAGS